MNFFAIILGLTMGNLCVAYLTGGNYGRAFEHSFMQVWALACYVVYNKVYSGEKK